MRGSKPVKIREILRLRDLGMNNVQIAQGCNCSRTTVIEMLKRADEAGLNWPEADILNDHQLKQRIYPTMAGMSVKKSDPDFEAMNRELKRSGVNLRLLWGEYKQIDADGLQYSQYCERYRQWCRKNNVTMHVQHKPGEKLFVDWTGDTMEVTNRMTGEKSRVYLFVSALGVSGYPYAEAFYNMSMVSWIAAHVHAFEYYGGAPRILVPDNLRTGVEKAHNYDPVENRSYREMAEHYSAAIVPARIRRPKDKAKVENAVGDIETWVMAALRNRMFFSLAELNQAILERLKAFSAKPFQKRFGSRESIFQEEDRPELTPLPSYEYELGAWKTATVQMNYHVEVEKQFYSVPYTYVSQKVDVRVSASCVEMFTNNIRICSHPRCFGKPYSYTTNTDHMPPHHKKYLEWDTERFLGWADKIGPAARDVVQAILASRKVEQQAYRSCFGLLKLAERYSTVRLEAACAHAVELRSPCYTTVHSMLKNGMDRPKAQPSSRSLPAHGNIRGPEYYAERR